MISNSLIEAIKARRSIRNFEDKPVPEEDIQAILEAGTYAPTALNLQPWKFTIVTSKAELKKLSDAAKPAIIKILPDIADESIMRLKQRLSKPDYNIFYGAPLLITIASMKSSYSVNDCSMAAQNMMLAAYSLGIGSCWIGNMMLIAGEPKIKVQLGIPEDHEIYSTLIFGYPKETPPAPERQKPQILKRID